MCLSKEERGEEREAEKGVIIGGWSGKGGLMERESRVEEAVTGCGRYLWHVSGGWNQESGKGRGKQGLKPKGVGRHTDLCC